VAAELILSDPERGLALAYAPRAVRPALAALWRLDEQLGEAVAATQNPALSQMRLTWWHDALSSMRTARPADPVLITLAEEDRIGPADLVPLIDGWEALLKPLPLTIETLISYSESRGAALFEVSARLLGGVSTDLAAAGRLWALIDLAFRISDRATAERALSIAPAVEAHWPKSLRPMAILTTLALRDKRRGLDAPRRQGSPARVARAAAAGLFGL
jgi:15-cis-phytoene synthase